MRTMDIRMETASRAPRMDDRPLLKRIGLIILATDHTTEVDFQRLVASERIGVYVTRIPYANPVTPVQLRLAAPFFPGGCPGQRIVNPPSPKKAGSDQWRTTTILHHFHIP